MDTIIINELEVRYRVGVPEAERAQAQRLLLTVEMDHDFGAAAACDDLNETIDYHAVAVRLAGFGAGREWKLIETLAVEIAGMILKEFKPERVRVEVRKFILPDTRWVGVKVERVRAGRV